MRVLLAASGLPPEFAGLAFEAAANIHNVMYSERVGMSRVEYRHGGKPAYSMMRWFGVKIFCDRPPQDVSGKLGSRRYVALYLSPDPLSSNQRVFDLEKMKVRLCASFRDLEANLVATTQLLTTCNIPPPMTLQQLVDEGVPLQRYYHGHTPLQARLGDGMSTDSGVQTEIINPSADSGGVEATTISADEVMPTAAADEEISAGDCSHDLSATSVSVSDEQAVVIPTSRRSRRHLQFGDDGTGITPDLTGLSAAELRRLRSDFAPGYYNHQYLVCALEDAAVNIPKSVKAAENSPQAVQWLEALEREYAQWLHHDAVEEVTWSEMRSNPGQLLNTFVLFSLKYQPDGSIKSYKARCVVDGSKEQFPDMIQQLRHTSTSVTTFPHILCHLNVATAENFEIVIADVAGAFFHGEIDESEDTIYLRVPDRFPRRDPDGPRTVLRLKKNLYGLKSAGKRYENAAFPIIEAAGLLSRPSDPCLFTNSATDQRLHADPATTIAGAMSDAESNGSEFDEALNPVTLRAHIYVDDQITTSKSLREAMDLLSNINESGLTYGAVGRIDRLLGHNFDESEFGLHVDLRSYIDKIATEDFMELAVREVTQPVTKDEVRAGAFARAGDDYQASQEDIQYFARVMGLIQWCASTIRLDVAVPASRLGRCVVNSTPLNIKAAIRTLKYLCSTRDLGYTYHRQGSPEYEMLQRTGMVNVLVAYSDSDFGGEGATDMRSTSGGVVLLNKEPVIAYSRVQKRVCTSTAMAETLALVEMVKTVEHLRRLLAQL